MRTLTTFLALVFGTICFAQDKNFERGEKLFQQLKYSEAIPYLKKSYDATTYYPALEYLAYASLYSKDYPSALTYFRLLAFDRKADPKFYLEYGKLLKNQGLYKEAKPWFIQYLRSNPGSMEVRQLLKSCDISAELLNNPLGFGITAWQHNTPQMEFSPAAYKGGWVFTSNRVKDLDGVNYGWDNLPYLKLMFVSDSGGPETFSYRLSGSYHTGPVDFTEDGNRVYITRNYAEGGKTITDENGVSRLMLLYSDYVEGKWTKPRPLNFNSKSYSVGHPCLSRDGSLLFFASDMPGGEGGSDIWMVRKVADNEWSAPENLGPKINSPGNELFPTLFADTLLSFSSDYLPGLGGLDIFYSVWKAGNWSYPVNLGYPVNSFKDDFGMEYREDGNSGFIASNRSGGKGFDDIYTFRKIKVCLNLTVMDSLSYDLLPKAVVRITDGFKYSEELVAGADGRISLCLPIDNQFKITVERKGYMPKRYTLSSKGQYTDKDTQMLAELVPGTMLSFSGIVRNDENDALIEGALIKIIGGNGFQEIITSDRSGYFDLAIDPKLSYQLSVSKEGFLLHSENFVMHDSVKTKEIRLRPGVINQKLKIRNIYYDLNSASIRTDAHAVLDTLVKIMKDNPYLQVEMGSHTDSRASDEYNEKLSMERAKAVIAYLSARGVDPYRITYAYYGETQLVVPCPDGVECGEEQHQLNRRTEFKIIAY